jgi:hypothetical protein
METLVMDKDRRLFEREPVIVEIEPRGQYPGKTFRVVDISLSGFKLETNYFMDVGQRFDFTFSLPKGKSLCRLTATVVWANQISSNPGHYRIGLEFPTLLEKLPDLFSLPLTEKEQAMIRDYAASIAISVPTRFWSFFSRGKSHKRSSSRSQIFS